MSTKSEIVSVPNPNLPSEVIRNFSVLPPDVNVKSSDDVNAISLPVTPLFLSLNTGVPLVSSITTSLLAPNTTNFLSGLLVPMPTLPSEVIRSFSVPVAPVLKAQ